MLVVWVVRPVSSLIRQLSKFMVFKIMPAHFVA
jgi:hypothetical protein